MYILTNPQRWSAYSEERYTPLSKDSRNTGVYLREVVVLIPDEKVDLFSFAVINQEFPFGLLFSFE